MWIVARERNALKQAEILSHRTTSLRYFRWNHAKQRSCWKRGTEILIGLPRFFLFFQTRAGPLWSDTTSTQLSTFILWIVSFVSSKYFGSFTLAKRDVVRSTRFFRFDFDTIQKWYHLISFATIGRCCATPLRAYHYRQSGYVSKFLCPYDHTQHPHRHLSPWKKTRLPRRNSN